MAGPPWMKVVLLSAVVATASACSSSSDSAADAGRDDVINDQESAREDSVEESPAGNLLPAFWFDFDDGLVEGTGVDAYVVDSSEFANRGSVEFTGTGSPPLRIVAGEDGSGNALKFPEPCGDPDDACPKAIITVADAPELSPVGRDFRYGARVLLMAPETSAGANILQKGFAVGGRSQWKLQVDGPGGRPSCVLVGQGESAVYRVVADVSVADGVWHQVSCRRESDELSIWVDGESRGRVPVPPALVIENDIPVRLGGKNVQADNDQFFGAVDDVFLAVDDAGEN